MPKFLLVLPCSLEVTVVLRSFWLRNVLFLVSPNVFGLLNILFLLRPHKQSLSRRRPGSLGCFERRRAQSFILRWIFTPTYQSLRAVVAVGLWNTMLFSTALPGLRFLPAPGLVSVVAPPVEHWTSDSFLVTSARLVVRLLHNQAGDCSPPAKYPQAYQPISSRPPLPSNNYR